MSVPVRDFLKRRRDRMVGSILGYFEREVSTKTCSCGAPKLTHEDQQLIRRIVLDACNGYHDSVLDLVKAEDGVRNDLVIEMLEQIDRKLPRRSVDLATADPSKTL